LRFNKNITIVLLRTTEWKLVFKPLGYHKLLLAIFGYLLGGSSGFVAGLIIGLFFDCEILVKHKPHKASDNRLSYLMLGAFILQVSELGTRISQATLHQRITKQFGEAYATKRLTFFNELLRQRIQVEAICDQIKAHAAEKEKIDVIRFLFALSNHPSAAKDKLHHGVNYVAMRIDLPYEEVKKVFDTFKSQSTNESTNASSYSQPKSTNVYSIFNLTSSCTEKELKSAYYKLAKKYHPDSNPTATTSEQKLMQEKFRKIVEAYEEIKHRRNWK